MKVKFVLIIGLLALVWPVEALILTGTGNKPVHDPGWPVGAVEVANLPSRIGWWEGPPFGGGEWHFEYRGNTDALQQALDAFSTVKAPVLDLFVQDGTKTSFVLDPNHKTTTNNIDWTFTAWVPERWQALYGSDHPIMFSDDPNAGKPMPAPRIDLYLGGNSQVAFDHVNLPRNVTLHDERATTAGVDTRAGTVLQITVSDAISHLPIAGAQARVMARDEKGRYTKPLTNGVSNEQGVALVTGLPAGVFQVSALAPGYVEAAIAYGGLQQWKGQQIQVEVTPSTGAVLGSWGGSANVGSDGMYFFAGVHPATYIVSVLNSTSRKRVTVAPREQAEVVLQLP